MRRRFRISCPAASRTPADEAARDDERADQRGFRICCGLTNLSPVSFITPAKVTAQPTVQENAYLPTARHRHRYRMHLPVHLRYICSSAVMVNECVPGLPDGEAWWVVIHCLNPCQNSTQLVGEAAQPEYCLSAVTSISPRHSFFKSGMLTLLFCLAVLKAAFVHPWQRWRIEM